jgi:hypothetical protein
VSQVDGVGDRAVAIMSECAIRLRRAPMRASETERHERATDEPWDDQQRDGIHVVSPLRTRLRRPNADGSPALFMTPSVVGDATPQARDGLRHRE